MSELAMAVVDERDYAAWLIIVGFNGWVMWRWLTFTLRSRNPVIRDQFGRWRSARYVHERRPWRTSRHHDYTQVRRRTFS